MAAVSGKDNVSFAGPRFRSGLAALLLKVRCWPTAAYRSAVLDGCFSDSELNESDRKRGRENCHLTVGLTADNSDRL